MNLLGDILSFELINALGWTILHSLWQGTVIVGILGMILIILRNNSSNLKYLVSAVAMFAILCLSISTFYSYYSDKDVLLIKNYGVPQESSLVPIKSIDEESATPNLFENKSVSMDIKAFLQNHLSLFVSIWFVGVIFFFIKFTGGFLYTDRIKTYKTKPVPESWKNRIDQLCQKMKINKTVRLLQSSVVKIPIVIGYFKPVILLPVTVLTGMPSDQIETILIHELAHISRRDYLVNILQSIMEILYFFHPAIWWISRIICVEREHCCDDIVVQLSRNSLNYVKALVDIETAGMTPVRSAVALISKKNILLNRIKRITQQPMSSAKFSTGFLSTLLIMATIITVALSVGNNAFSIQNQNENAEKSGFLNFDYSGEWWYPIIKKHNISLQAFSNFDYVLETGKSNQIDDKKRITLDASVIINTGDDYLIIKSSEAVYTNNDSTYKFTNAELNRFSRIDLEPKIKEKLKCRKLEIKFGKSINGTPTFLITNLDKPQITNSDNKWFPKKFSKADSLITDSIQDKSGKKSILSGEFQAENWIMDDSISIGNDIIFRTWHGVELEADKLKFNKNTETFETDLLKFIIMKNKVVINFLKNADGKYEYTANEIYREGRFIRLLGNAIFYTDKTKLKANEIIIDITI